MKLITAISTDGSRTHKKPIYDAERQKKDKLLNKVEDHGQRKSLQTFRKKL